MNVVKDPEKDPHYQQNPSVGTYIATTKNISALLTKLGMTAQERTKLEIEGAKGEDQLTLLLTESKSKGNGTK
jgi:hypothetical protein